MPGSCGIYLHRGQDSLVQIVCEYETRTNILEKSIPIISNSRFFQLERGGVWESLFVQLSENSTHAELSCFPPIWVVLPTTLFSDRTGSRRVWGVGNRVRIDIHESY